MTSEEKIPGGFPIEFFKVMCVGMIPDAHSLGFDLLGKIIEQLRFGEPFLL